MQWVVSWNPLRNKSTKPPLSPPMDDGEDRNSKLQEAEAEQQMQQDDHDGRRPDSSEETLVRIPGGAVVYLVEVGEESLRRHCEFRIRRSGLYYRGWNRHWLSVFSLNPCT